MYLNHPMYRQELTDIFNLPLPWALLDGKTVLVTGATGLIGSAMVDALRLRNELFDANIRILALCRREVSFAVRFGFGDGIVPVFQDVAQPLKLTEDIHFIIHAAGNAHPMAFSQQPVETLLDSVLSTRNLLDKLRTQGFGRLLYTSSGEIYGENPDIPDGYAETDFGRIDPVNPRACYPEGKRAAETLCAAFSKEYGVDSVIARLCYVYGAPITPASSRADAQFLRRASESTDIVMKSPGAQIRSYCYLPDAAAALFTLLLKGERAQAYNVAGESASIREYAQHLADHAGVKLVFDLPPEAERSGYSQVTRAVQKSDKLHALGWQPMYPLREGLRRTLTLFRDLI